MSHDGRAKPLTVGVSVHKDAKASDLLEAIRQHPAAACNPEEELVLGKCSGDTNTFIRPTIMHDLSVKACMYEYQAKSGCAFFRAADVCFPGPTANMLHAANVRPVTVFSGYPCFSSHTAVHKARQR